MRKIKDALGKEITVAGGGPYTVKPGDSWGSISEKFYGNERYFEQLVAANGGAPLRCGMMIGLPALEVEGKSTASLADLEREIQRSAYRSRMVFPGLDDIRASSYYREPQNLTKTAHCDYCGQAYQWFDGEDRILRCEGCGNRLEYR